MRAFNFMKSICHSRLPGVCREIQYYQASPRFRRIRARVTSRALLGYQVICQAGCRAGMTIYPAFYWADCRGECVSRRKNIEDKLMLPASKFLII